MERSHGAPRVGLVCLPVDAAETVDLIVRAEQAGVEAVWLEMNAVGLDPFPVLAVAAARTERIVLGTAIVPAFGRHPVTLATQILAVEGLAPGRFRVGIGPGNAERMATAFGVPRDRHLARLREYVEVLRPILQRGEVAFEGEFYQANIQVPVVTETPVLMSAVGVRAFEAAGELADGVLSWLYPVDHLLDVARPALEHGAELAGREPPHLVAHVPVALAGGDTAGREAVREDLAMYARVPVFGRMFADAGHAVVDGLVPDSLLSSLVVSGDADAIATQLTSLLRDGIDEVMVSRTPETADRAQEDALLHALGRISRG